MPVHHLKIHHHKKHPTMGGAAKHKAPWQVKGSLAAKQHMAAIRARKRH